MPVPAEIRDGPYLLVGQFAKVVGPAGADPRPGKQNRQFHGYRELYFQGKHDGVVRTYCSSQRPPIECRPAKDTQVVYDRRQTMAEFYRARADTACTRVARHMTTIWANAPAANHGSFVRGAKNIMAVQGERQPDGHGYDISFWYEGRDVYVTFHYYPK